MRPSRTPALSGVLLLGALATTSAPIAAASRVVSAADARLPMSLSTVIQDLEAEGCDRITTAAFITSKSVRRSQASTLLKRLFGVTGDGGSDEDDEDEEVEYGVTTAFGKKINDTDEEESAESNDGDTGGGGVAVACPPCSPRLGATASDVSATVVACGGTVVYVADAVDLGRGEGLFDYLGPAVERLLAFRNMAEGRDRLHPDQDTLTGWRNRPSSLVVVFSGLKNEGKREMEGSKRLWESAASQMLASIIQPAGAPRATRLEDVFGRVEYLPPSGADADALLCPAGGRVSSPSSPASRDPAEVASGVSDVVNAGLVDKLGPVVEATAKVPVKQSCPRLTSPVDLAAARLLGPLAHKALDECLETVRKATGEDGKKLVPDFGELCGAAMKRATESLDAAVGPRLRKSPVAKRIRAGLQENLYSEMGDVYEAQVASLREASFAGFRARLNKLRIGPGLPDQMKEAAEGSLKEFATAVKKLRVPRATSYGSWMTNVDHISSLKARFAEHNTERLRAAHASGQFKPIPRKGVTVGLHWLLPKPFGNDYRQEPHLTHAPDDLVFMPVDGITDVSGNEIRSGDWRKGVVPAPSGSDMMYLK